MDTLDHDGGPVVATTPQLVARMAEALDGPTRRKARVLEAVLAVIALVALVVVLATGAIGWWAVLTPLLLAGVLALADVGRRRTLLKALARQERYALRYDAPARLLRFPESGSERPVDDYRRARVVDDVLVLERRDGTRTPVPPGAISESQRGNLLADLGSR